MHGRFVGRRAMLSVTVGTSEATYAYNGRSGDVDLMLWPVNFSLAYVGYEVLKPFVAYGVEAGQPYSEADVVEARLQQVEADLIDTLNHLDERQSVLFNTKAEWGDDGRITPVAPSHSAFIRHNEHLDLG